MIRHKWLLAAILGITAFAFLIGTSLAAPKSRKARGKADAKTEAKAKAKAETVTEEGKGFAAYQIITERNIFSSTRSPMRRKSEADGPAPAPAPDSVDLLGSWITNRQSAAFTEGAKSEYTGALQVGGALGGWKLLEITMNHVVIAKGEKKLVWPVGRRIERDSEGNWTLSEKEATPLQSQPAAAAPSKASGDTSAADLLQLMRERRKRETE